MCFSKNLNFVPKLSFNLFLYIFYLKKILYMNSCSNVHMKETPVCEIESVNHEAVEYVTKQLCSDDEIYRFTELFKVLATPSRLKILFALQHHELCVCDLAIVLNTTTSSVSHQLSYYYHLIFFVCFYLELFLVLHLEVLLSSLSYAPQLILVYMDLL